MHIKSISWLLIITSLLGLSCAPLFRVHTASKNVLLGSPVVFADDPLVANAVNSYDLSNEAGEKAKIDYLLKRIETSPAEFIRNNEVHDGIAAAEHFRRKYEKNEDAVDTSEEFIEDVASYSKTSGSPYLVRMNKKKTYHLEQVLKNELNQLENYIKKKR